MFLSVFKVHTKSITEFFSFYSFCSLSMSFTIYPDLPFFFFFVTMFFFYICGWKINSNTHVSFSIFMAAISSLLQFLVFPFNLDAL